MRAAPIVALVGVAGLAALGLAAHHAAAQPTVRVAPAVMTERLIARGEVVAVDGVAEVRARVEGRVLRVLVREGDRVEAGQLLAEIESDSLAAEVQRRQAERRALDAAATAMASPPRRDERALAEAEAGAAREELTLALDRAARAERLRGAESIPPSELLAARAGAEVARERVRMAEARVRLAQQGARRDEVRAAQARAEAAGASVELARRDLARTQVTSPIAGVVLARRVDPGDTLSLTSTLTEPLFDLADPSRVEVRAEIEEIDAPRVRAGMRASLTLVGDPRVVAEGEVVRVSPRLERRRVGVEDVRVRAEGVVRMVWIAPSTAGDALAIGQRLDAHVAFAPTRREATLPRSAVRVVDGRAVVRAPRWAGLLRDERAVRLGVADAERVEVLGLAAGTEVSLRAAP